MNPSEANGFILEQDFHEDEGPANEVMVTHTDDPAKALQAFVNMVKGFIDISPTFSVRMYAVQFEAESKEDRDAETLRISSKNFQHCKAVQVGAFFQVENTILVDLNAFIGPVVKYGHDGDDKPHTHGTPKE